ncbi:MAG: hypothetical protein ACRDKJ_09425 [Actinomycetota bacterium]
MAVDERSRHELHRKLEQALGPDEAATLMSYLPPFGWADVVTKRDLDGAVDGLRHSIMADVRAELIARDRHLINVILTVAGGQVAAMGGLFFAAAKLL